MKNLFLAIFVLISLNFSAQEEIQWLKIRPYLVAELSDSLQENSGLDLFQNRLLTFNDSGNSSEIFELNKNSGKIKNSFKTNLKNTDWEAITNDSTNIYIGDFGNNAGTRKDLKIYKLKFDRTTDSLNVTSAQEISFYYPEQKNFSPKNLNNNFDGEAMIYLNGKLHLFTKEWASKKTTHYLIDPEISLNQAAEKIELYPTDYVVTDAAYFDKKLYLIGYTKTTDVYLSIFDETKPGIFFEQKSRKFYLGSAFSIGQIEGIAVDKTGIFISGENFKTPFGKSKQKLYFIPLEKFN